MAKENNEAMGSTGIRFSRDQLDRCDAKSRELGISRNEFVRDAVEFYLEWLAKENSEKFLTPALESVIEAKIRDTEERLSRILFKLAVDQNILAYVFINEGEYDGRYIEELRQQAINDLKSTNGTLSARNILRGDAGRWQG
jgi:predicted DNA-binding protein